jgi:hypothetical protein
MSNLIPTQLTIPIEPINKGDGHLRNCITHRLSQNNQLHLKDISLALHLRNDGLQHILLVKAKATREIRNSRLKKRVGETRQKEISLFIVSSGLDGSHVGPFWQKLSLQIPAVYAAIIASIPRSRHNIVVVGRLYTDHLGYKFRVVAEVGVHNNDEVASGELD